MSCISAARQSDRHDWMKSTYGVNRMGMLVPDDQFPDIELDIVGGGSISLPSDAAGHWTYVLFYRGGW